MCMYFLFFTAKHLANKRLLSNAACVAFQKKNSIEQGDILNYKFDSQITHDTQR